MEASDSQDNPQDMNQEKPDQSVFVAPSIHQKDILDGISYTHHSPVPKAISEDSSARCVLGVDEAGRGPVLGR